MEMILLVSTIIAVLAPLIGAFVSLLLKKWTSIRDIFGVLTIAISAIAAIIIYLFIRCNFISLHSILSAIKKIGHNLKKDRSPFKKPITYISVNNKFIT